MTLLNNIQYFSQDNTGHNIRMEFDLFIVHIDVISTGGARFLQPRCLQDVLAPASFYAACIDLGPEICSAPLPHAIPTAHVCSGVHLAGVGRDAETLHVGDNTLTGAGLVFAAGPVSWRKRQ